MTKVDKFNFADVYYWIGKITTKAHDDPVLKAMIENLTTELDYALGYIDTSPKTRKEFQEEHVHGEVMGEVNRGYESQKDYEESNQDNPDFK